ncbi:cytochrome c oxidase subunit 6B2-like [Venturia canescens]|uniref:cytochrome c oxidase subunit 6B2-like n=1 Tax=Venturia canescens TaxID=32260 RepID=UPI001C9C5349|nr:cytochrome c oxidase subunit 6B2-like [Venturia canescens]
MPELKSIDQIKTPPFDPRFPNQNQTRNCYQNFVDYHRCVKVRGEEFGACKELKQRFTSLCPCDWVEKWTEQIDEGKFPGQI